MTKPLGRKMWFSKEGHFGEKQFIIGSIPPVEGYAILFSPSDFEAAARLIWEVCIEKGDDFDFMWPELKRRLLGEE